MSFLRLPSCSCGKTGGLEVSRVLSILYQFDLCLKQIQTRKKMNREFVLLNIASKHVKWRGFPAIGYLSIFSTSTTLCLCLYLAILKHSDQIPSSDNTNNITMVLKSDQKSAWRGTH
jgi:hypothetical protein